MEISNIDHIADWPLHTSQLKCIIYCAVQYIYQFNHIMVEVCDRVSVTCMSEFSIFITSNYFDYTEILLILYALQTDN